MPRAKKKLNQFEEGEKKVKDGTELLISKEDVQRVMAENPSLTPIEAGRLAVEKATEEVTKELTARIIQYFALVFASVVATASAVFFLMASNKKVCRISIIIGFVSLAASILGNVWGIANGYSAFPMQMTALIVVFATAFCFATPLCAMMPMIKVKPEVAVAGE